MNSAAKQTAACALQQKYGHLCKATTVIDAGRVFLCADAAAELMVAAGILPAGMRGPGSMEMNVSVFERFVDFAKAAHSV